MMNPTQVGTPSPSRSRTSGSPTAPVRMPIAVIPTCVVEMTRTGSSISRSAASAPRLPASARDRQRRAARGHHRVLADHEERVAGDQREHGEDPQDVFHRNPRLGISLMRWGRGRREDHRTLPFPLECSPRCSTAREPYETYRPCVPASAARSSARSMRATTRPARHGTSPPTSGPASSRSPRARTTSSRSSSYARQHGLRVVPQGTGHNATPIAWHEDTILLSTSRMRGVEIDVAGRRARVAAGTALARGHRARVRAQARPARRLARPTSASSATASAAASAGSPASTACRPTASWRSRSSPPTGVCAASTPTHDPDLFWALRGGGGNFGVVTAMEIALYPLPELYAGAMFWPWERSAEVMHAWREWTLTARTRSPRRPASCRCRRSRRCRRCCAAARFVTIDAADHRRPRVRRRGRAGAARPRAGDRHVRHGRAGRAVAAAQRPRGPDAGA